jgi:hypothetical protein
VLEIRVLRRRVGFEGEEVWGDFMFRICMVFTAHRIFLGCQIKGHKICGTCGTYGVEE